MFKEKEEKKRRVKIFGRELSRLEKWTFLRQKACAILSVFVETYFLGPYLH